LISAILLEEAANCFLDSFVSLKRKHIFYLVLAADRFIKCGHKKHGIDLYMKVLTVLSDLKWSAILDHIYFNLSRQSYQIGNHREAMNYMIQLMSNPKRSSANQNLHVHEFLYIYNVIFLSNKFSYIQRG
jgi:hypothetical protein